MPQIPSAPYFFQCDLVCGAPLISTPAIKQKVTTLLPVYFDICIQAHLLLHSQSFPIHDHAGGGVGQMNYNNLSLLVFVKVKNRSLMSLGEN